jgi:hypothetical protein
MGTLHLLAVQLALMQDRCYKQKSGKYEVTVMGNDLYCGLLQSYLPLLVKKVHPTNREEPLGWDDPRSKASVDLLPAALTDHLPKKDVDDLQVQGYALLGHWLYMLVDELHVKEILDVAVARRMYKNCMRLHSASMGVEKISNTPMPGLIKVGVSISTNLYCYLCFPMVMSLQVQLDLAGWEKGWPRVFMISCLVLIYFVTIQLIFVLLVLGIHFEDPYGDDSYDLPLVRMIQKTHRDIHAVFHNTIAHRVPASMHPELPAAGGYNQCDTANEGMRKRFVGL